MTYDDQPQPDPQREAYRNGELPRDEAAAFEKRLADDAALRRDFDAETQMLALLAGDDEAHAFTEDQAMALSPEAFTQAVLTRWDAHRDSHRAAHARRSAWRTPLRLTLTAFAAAAAVALLAYVGIQMLATTAPEPSALPIAETVSPAPDAPLPDGGQAMASLVKETQATIVDRPRVLWLRLEERVSTLSILQLSDLLPSSLPDPAMLLEEPAGEDAGNSAHLRPIAPTATL